MHFFAALKDRVDDFHLGVFDEKVLPITGGIGGLCGIWLWLGWAIGVYGWMSDKVSGVVLLIGMVIAVALLAIPAVIVLYIVWGLSIALVCSIYYSVFFGRSFWESTFALRRLLFKQYYERKEAAEAERLLKIKQAEEAAKNSAINGWQKLQQEIKQEISQHRSNHIDFQLNQEVQDFADSFTPEPHLSEGKWHEAIKIIHGGKEKIAALRKRRLLIQEQAPLIEKKWREVQSYGERLLSEARSLDLSGNQIGDLRELFSTIEEHGNALLANQDWQSLDEINAAAKESLEEHDHIAKLLAELELDRTNIDLKTLKSSYRQMTKKYHPDLGSEGDNDKMASINTAYTLMSSFLKNRSL